MQLHLNKPQSVIARKTWAVIILLGVSAIASAQPSTYATGLTNPTKVILGPAGTLLVSDMTNQPGTGRISLIRPGGTRSTLIDGLPSGPSAPNGDADGPTDMVLSGHVLYVEIGEGDTLVVGPRQGTEVGNPVGPSSPIFATILKFTFTDTIDSVINGFTLKPQDHFTLLDGAVVSLTNAAGSQATAELVTQFRPATPDPNALYRNSHPYSMTVLDSQPDTLYVADAGQNTVVQVGITSGRAKVITRFAPTPNPGPGPPVIEAVPTSVRPFQDSLLVSLLTGAPFVNLQSRIMAVNPKTGVASLFITLLSSAIDVLYRQKADGSPEFFTLEYSLGLTSGKAGRLLVFDSPAGRTVSDTLVAPSSMTLDPVTGTLYITSKTAGTIVAFDVGK
jgi:hypothetical protein